MQIYHVHVHLRNYTFYTNIAKEALLTNLNILVKFIQSSFLHVVYISTKIA